VGNKIRIANHESNQWFSVNRRQSHCHLAQLMHRLSAPKGVKEYNSAFQLRDTRD
jgi:hypothetical protein